METAKVMTVVHSRRIFRMSPMDSSREYRGGIRRWIASVTRRRAMGARTTETRKVYCRAWMYRFWGFRRII